MHAQPGIFALGTSDHCYLELDLREAADAVPVVRAAAGLFDELSTTGGVNVVVGLRPGLWAEVADPGDVPQARDWATELTGPDGFTMPATPHDLWIWISGGNRTAVFDSGRFVVQRLDSVVTVASETAGWLYRHDRDLTGFIDGTENPSLLEAPGVVSTPADRRGAGSSVVLHQLWRHDSGAWERAGVQAQQRAMGRTKDDSTELAASEMPPDAHVARTVIEVDGEQLDIFRRNVAYGGVTDHGTVFVGFSHDQWRLHEMLRRMAGIPDGIRCALTRYVTPTTGAYYVVPSVEALRRLTDAEPDVVR